VAGLSPEVVALAVEPEAVSVAGLSPEVVALAVEPEASVDIAVVSVVLVPVSVVVAEVDSSGHPTFLASPNVDHYANCSSSVEVVGEESVHSPTGARTNYGRYSTLSNLGLHQNKNLEH